MATLAVTIPPNNAKGGLSEVLMATARALQELAAGVPDKTSTGSDSVITFDNAPATGAVSVAITAGPYQQAARIV